MRSEIIANSDLIFQGHQIVRVKIPCFAQLLYNSDNNSMLTKKSKWPRTCMLSHSGLLDVQLS